MGPVHGFLRLDGFGYTDTPMRYTGDDGAMDAIFRDFPFKVTLMTTIDEGYADLGDLGRIFKPKRYLAMIAQPPMWSVSSGKLSQAEHYLCIPYDTIDEFHRDWSLIAEFVEPTH